MMNWNELVEMQDEAGAAFGDPRRCPKHGCVTSSPDGLHDAPCGHCEHEMAMEELAHYEATQPPAPRQVSPPRTEYEEFDIPF